jgi:glycine/D-amino acid oxidase-like deaminating enzyme
VVIGGGVVGAALAWGLARAAPVRPLVLDEGDLAPRASRANNALLWIQGKGLGLPAYALWSQRSAERWPALAAALAEETGIDVMLSQRGGFTFCLSQAELDRERGDLERIALETGGRAAPFEELDSAGTRARLPMIGPAVVGSLYGPRDGQVNMQRLLHALHAALAARGCEYRAGHGVRAIEPGPDGFRIRGDWGDVTCDRVVLAAGLGNAALAPMVGLASPLKWNKGQILVTEKCAPCFPYASTLFIQGGDGGFLIGASSDAQDHSEGTDPTINAVLAKRAVRAFPALGAVGVVRSWAGFRVKTLDGFPIYDQSESAPGAFVATCHSGVTLAAVHALDLAPRFLAGSLDDELSPYRAGRFHVPTHP